MNTINFTARFLQKSQVNKIEPDKSYSPCDISIIELDENNHDDIEALHKTAIRWNRQGGGYFAYDMYNEVNNDYKDNNIENDHYIAATTQEADFENIDPEKILGLTLFSEKNYYKNEINFLEVEPINSHRSRFGEYKKVGSALLNYIQDTYKQKPIYKNA